MNRKQIEEEILASGLSHMDTQILLWYLGLCKTASQWQAFAKCDFVSTGPYSYQSQRRWYVTNHLILLSRGVDDWKLQQFKMEK